MGALGSKLGETTSDLHGVLASQAASASLSWKKFRSGGGGDDDEEDGGAIDTGFSRYDGDVYEGEPLLPEEVLVILVRQRQIALCHGEEQ